MTCMDTPNVTSSRESVAGHEHLNLQDGQPIGQCGREAVHASHIRSVETSKAVTTSEIYGQSSLASLKSANLRRSSESKLRRQLDMDGSTVFVMTWKEKGTPSGRVYSHLASLARRKNVNDSGGVPTPAARDYRDLSNSTAFLSQRHRKQPSLATALQEAGMKWWQIPTAYCVAMGYPLRWLDALFTDSETPSSLK